MMSGKPSHIEIGAPDTERAQRFWGDHVGTTKESHLDCTNQPMTVDSEEALAGIRALCLAFPGTSERPSHGSPTFFIRGKRAFAT